MNKFLGAFFVLMYVSFCSLGSNRFSVDVWLFGGCHGFGITGYLRAPDTMAPKTKLHGGFGAVLLDLELSSILPVI